MTNFLFWNINRKPIGGLIAALVEDHRIDVLMLAECEIEPVDMLRSLNSGEIPRFHFAPSASESVQVFIRFSDQFLRELRSGSRYSIRELALPGRVSVLLAMLHFPSLLQVDENSQTMEATIVSRKVRLAEDETGHKRTVLIGDLNMHPFSDGLVGAAALNAVMHRETARRGSRKLRGELYPFFYNPMWNHYGDEQGTAGTYYYAKEDHVAYYWHMYDQVLVRPALLERFPVSGVTIPTSAGGFPLLDRKGHPDKSAGSDHLPIVFSLDLEGAGE